MTHLALDVLADKRYEEVRKRSYIALDVPSWEEAVSTVSYFGEAVDGYKVGLELFHRAGQKGIESLLRLQKRVFLDVKLHDIPNTVAGALRAICEAPIELVNVHALGGRKMMEAARRAVDESPNHPKLIAVTILTSLDQDELACIQVSGHVREVVSALARLTAEAGLDGVVASAHELEQIRAQAPAEFEVVVPGTRPMGAELHDQARAMTPGEAMSRGATHLVLGRAVLKAPDPSVALRQIWDDMLGGCK